MKIISTAGTKLDLYSCNVIVLIDKLIRVAFENLMMLDKCKKFKIIHFKGARDGTEVREFASH